MSRIFALDASGKTGGVCILEGERVLYSKQVDQGLTHSETLLALVQEALDAAGMAPAGVALYGVTAGPGSFTGLRIGMALVKGLALPWGTPVAPVSTLRAHAMAAQGEGVVAPALNARRGEVYWAAFGPAPGRERLSPDAVGPAGQVDAFLERVGKPAFFVGDGAEICYTISKYEKIRPPEAGAPHEIAVGAALAAADMLRKNAIVSASDARPNYIRLSQAERERLQKQSAGGA